MSPANALRPNSPIRQLFVIAAITLVPVLIIGLILGGSYRSEATRRGLVQGRDEAQLMAQSAIEPLLNGQPLSSGLTSTETARLRTLATDVVRSGSVQRLRLRDIQGNVVFSDDGSGFHAAIENEALTAAHGHMVIRLTHLNADSVDRGKVKGLSVEVYMPLYVGNATNRVGVLEMYLPYTPISVDVNAGIHMLYRNLAVGLALLYLILLSVSHWVTRRLRRQVKVNAYQSEHDALTDLPNRVLFHQMANAELNTARKHARPTTIAIIDLDRFKEVNDTLGHQNGDLLLTLIGDRLRAHLRSPDVLARFGGDEFGVVLSDVGDPTDVLMRLREVIQDDLEVGGLPLSIEASIGYVVAPQDGSSVDELLQRADVAMYVAKSVRSGVIRYDDSQDHYDASKLTLVTELRQAIASNQLVLHYQPKVAVGDQGTKGVEALVRWQHPILGLLYPDRFIPLVEQTDLIDELTDWVIQNALADLAALGPRFETMQLSVNVSARNLGRAEFARKVIERLTEAATDPSRLTVEVTETSLMAEPERAAASLLEMSLAGVRISIDDFGSGQTSLGLLANLPISELKIDRSFIQDVHSSPANAAIVRSMVELGHQLELVVVAEGVETMDELNAVVATGCDLVQGYFYARPMPCDQLVQWMERREFVTSL
jgi:diguanylate cyclase (GGDEF)-like protein